ncbi:MAG: cytochrome d ubiquinol oxidase subunit II [Bacillota bacterium]|jgi:cytochrome d ubiquinol oxidase subunit II
MNLEILQVIWFLLILILITGYALLAGTDIGAGNLHLFIKNPRQREDNYYAVGPFWDSNQVWLITGGGAIFAAFPMVYATAFSGFYLAIMLILLAIIFRSVAIEFQHQLDASRWKKVWDLCFGWGSILLSALFGVAMGNILRGLPLDRTYNFSGSFLGLLNPYALAVGLLSLAMFTMHGAAFLIARMEGELRLKARVWGKNTWVVLVALYILVTVWSYIEIPRLFDNFFRYPVFFLIPIIGTIALVYYPFALKAKRTWMPLFYSMLTIIGFIGTVGAGLFPVIIPSNPYLEYSLTIFNASSSLQTLTVMLVIAMTGIPLVILYSAYVYRKFMKKQNQNFPGQEKKANILG